MGGAATARLVTVLVVAIAMPAAMSACGSSAGDAGEGLDAGPAAETGPAHDAASASDAGGDAAQPQDSAAPPVDSLPANRDRLLATYLAYLKANPAAQSNGLSGAALPGVCELWRRLDPSSQGAFLTLTARMQGSKLSKDGSSMLVHVTRLYRAVGGEGATITDPGSCGGGEFNRLMMSMDATLHGALVLANTNKGAPNGANPDIQDVNSGNSSHWRNSHDVGGAHAPFDLSDETENGAPRRQVQYFRDPSSALAKAPLGRMDLAAIVDPYALEIDQDYDCVHSSNALCDYTTYGALCFPGASTKGTDLYTMKYGSFDPAWQPVDCKGK